MYKKWRRLKGIVYFNVDMRSSQQKRDWRLTSPPKALDAYESIAAQPRFQGRIQ